MILYHFLADVRFSGNDKRFFMLIVLPAVIIILKIKATQVGLICFNFAETLVDFC